MFLAIRFTTKTLKGIKGKENTVQRGPQKLPIVPFNVIAIMDNALKVQIYPY